MVVSDPNVLWRLEECRRALGLDTIEEVTMVFLAIGDYFYCNGTGEEYLTRLSGPAEQRTELPRLSRVDILISDQNSLHMSDEDAS
jgi:hypothetical protein